MSFKISFYGEGWRIAKTVFYYTRDGFLCKLREICSRDLWQRPIKNITYVFSQKEVNKLWRTKGQIQHGHPHLQSDSISALRLPSSTSLPAYRTPFRIGWDAMHEQHQDTRQQSSYSRNLAWRELKSGDDTAIFVCTTHSNYNYMLYTVNWE
jgi:hypothetical protein